ncbi:hypothetical protein KC19_11G143500 [Ceratodon purpureus]|uniref:Uncharacterized protein n=1 Tax=Ceratodon purpureus TaxID=3225 RepID=A0A8T0GHF7_CERPU|nr:hypothetical protein KC19_11G143500 [Ceratodon purpureus]
MPLRAMLFSICSSSARLRLRLVCVFGSSASLARLRLRLVCVFGSSASSARLRLRLVCVFGSSAPSSWLLSASSSRVRLLPECVFCSTFSHSVAPPAMGQDVETTCAMATFLSTAGDWELPTGASLPGSGGEVYMACRYFEEVVTTEYVDDGYETEPDGRDGDKKKDNPVRKDGQDGSKGNGGSG